MLEADGGFRYSWEGKSEVNGKVGLCWLRERSILWIVDVRGWYRYEAAMCMVVSVVSSSIDMG